MSEVFVSSPSLSDKLFDRIETALDNVGYNTVGFDWDASDGESTIGDLKSTMGSCDMCFVFPAVGVHSQNDGSIERQIAETTIAGSLDVPVAIFKQEGEDHQINFLHFDMFVSYDRESLPIQLQEQIEEVKETQGHEGLGLVGGGLLGLATIGTGGAALVGAMLGGALLAGGEQKAVVGCPNCKMNFGYWGEDDEFICPHCHTEMDSQLNAVDESEY